MRFVSAPSHVAAGRLRRAHRTAAPIFVAFVIFLLTETPFVSVAPLLL